MLALVFPAGAHEHRRVEGRASAPRRTGGVRTLALEAENRRDQGALAALAPRHAEPVAHVGEERDIGIAE